MSINSRAAKAVLSSINEKKETDWKEETETASTNSSRMSSASFDNSRKQQFGSSEQVSPPRPSNTSTPSSPNPYLDTIESKSSESPRQQPLLRRNSAESGEISPRSIEYVDTGMGSTGGPESLSEGSNGPPRTGSRRPRRHRRANSEDVPREVQGFAPQPVPPPGYYQTHQPPLYSHPPPHPANVPRNGYGYNSHMVHPGTSPSYGTVPHPFGTPLSSPGFHPGNSFDAFEGDFQPYHHHAQQGFFQPDPHQGMQVPQPARGRANSYSGNQESKPLLHPQHSSGPPKPVPRPGHRKSLSSSAAMPGYGAFWNNQEATTNSVGSANSGNFSPRGDLMGLTSSLRGNQINSPRMSPLTLPRKNVTWSPSQGGMHPSSPVVPALVLNDSNGGEAMFTAQRRQRPESSRKRHMRQQSAQIYMEDIKGTEQAPSCRDIIFLLGFVFHLFFIAYLNNTYAWAAIKDPTEMGPSEETGSQVVIFYQNLIVTSLLCGVFAASISAALLVVVTTFAHAFIQVALIVVITLSFVWGTVGVGLSPKSVVPITGVIALALSVAYTFIVWDRIPFAAANLATALSGVKAFPGTIVVAFCVQAVALANCIYYVVTVTGVYDAIEDGRIQVSEREEICIYVFLGISFYWTYNVLLNIVQVSTAKVIGSWWFRPENAAGAKESSFRTIFYSMGSICFGSLVVGPVVLIRQVAVVFRPSPGETSLLCFHQCLFCIQNCITSCVEYITDSINPWAMTYIGLYGYGFIDAGRHATDLFDKRGWTTIVSDDLIPNVLVMTALCIGGVTGCFGYFLAGLDGLHVTSLKEPGMVSFVVGVAVGVALTAVLFGIISSSVNAIIVCFAANPVDFERNHPTMSREMRSAWREVWPGALDMVDLRVATQPHLAAPIVPIV